jgi:hypothetical protein
MRGTMSLALLAGTSLACSTASAQYVMNNSSPGTFTDISATGTHILDAINDDGIATFTSSVTNTLVPSASLQACVNGWIANAGSSPASTYSNTTLPAAAAGSLFLPVFWDDLYLYNSTPPSGYVTHLATTEGGFPVHIIEWVNIRAIGYPAGTPCNFEVKIWGAGAPTLVQYLYQDVSFAGSAGTGNGANATVGVQWGAANAIQYAYNTANSIPNNSVVSVLADTTPGACCTGGVCSTTTASSCVAGGGTFTGGSCSAGICVGRCCNTDGTCSVVTPAACTGAGGVFAGTNTDCTGFTCPQPGSCCKAGGVCSIAPQSVCVNGGGVYGGDGTTCAAATCNPQYFYDDGVSENNIGFAGTAASIAWLNQYAVVNNRSVVNSIDIAFGLNTTTPSLNGYPVTVYLWSDPNGDGNPTDAVVLASASGVVANSGTDTYNAFPITPTNVGANGTKFFVGAIVNGVVVSSGGGCYPCRIDQTHTQGKSWISGNATTVPIDPANLANSGTGVAVIDSFGPTLAGNWMVRADAATTGSGCYANCDSSTQLPFLNVQDFSCFLTKYAAGNSYANCDNSTQIPVLNVQDFSCFLTKYAAGCSAP